jgi:hypothetical protein
MHAGAERKSNWLGEVAFRHFRLVCKCSRKLVWDFGWASSLSAEKPMQIYAPHYIISLDQNFVTWDFAKRGLSVIYVMKQSETQII